MDITHNLINRMLQLFSASEINVKIEPIGAKNNQIEFGTSLVLISWIEATERNNRHIKNLNESIHSYIAIRPHPELISLVIKIHPALTLTLKE